MSRKIFLGGIGVGAHLGWSKESSARTFEGRSLGTPYCKGRAKTSVAPTRFLANFARCKVVSVFPNRILMATANVYAAPRTPRTKINFVPDADLRRLTSDRWLPLGCRTCASRNSSNVRESQKMRSVCSISQLAGCWHARRVSSICNWRTRLSQM